jgi:hypothetical protein
LWASVIEQAFRDLCSHDQGRVFREACADAEAWFRRGGLDFRETCDRAGIDADAVRRVALRIIAQPIADRINPLPTRAAE